MTEPAPERPPWTPEDITDEMLPAWLETYSAHFLEIEHHARATGDTEALADVAAAREAMFQGFKTVFEDTMSYSFPEPPKEAP